MDLLRCLVLPFSMAPTNTAFLTRVPPTPLSEVLGLEAHCAGYLSCIKERESPHAVKARRLRARGNRAALPFARGNRTWAPRSVGPFSSSVCWDRLGSD